MTTKRQENKETTNTEKRMTRYSQENKRTSTEKAQNWNHKNKVLLGVVSVFHL